VVLLGVIDIMSNWSIITKDDDSPLPVIEVDADVMLMSVLPSRWMKMQTTIVIVYRDISAEPTMS